MDVTPRPLRSMKKFLLIALTLFALTACHKAIWDKLNDHETRIQRL